jgi:putative membrane protein
MSTLKRHIHVGILTGLAATIAVAQTNPPTQATPGETRNMSPTARDMSDQTFVREASAAGLAEVRDAQAALQSAKRPEVRKAAQQILTDHTAANARLRSLAEKKSLALSAAPAQAQAQSSAADFDSAWVQAQIQAHQQAIELFRTQSLGGSDSDLREFASSTLPTLQHHLSMMQGLQ